MNSSDILAVVGLIFTITFGILAIKRHRYPGQFTFIKEISLGLFDSLVKYFPELEIQYHKQPVTEGLVLLKGALLNTGTKDIDEGMTKESIHINLPDKFRWLSVKVVSSSPQLKVNTLLSDKSINIQTKLFRCGEFVRFEALAEVPIDNSLTEKRSEDLEVKLEKAISISHRITDTQKVLIRDLPSCRGGNRRATLAWIMLAFTIILTLIVSSRIYLKGWPAETHFTIKESDNTNVEVKVIGIYHDQLKLRGVKNKNYQKTVPQNLFPNMQGLKPVITKDTADLKFIIVILTLQYALVIFQLFFTYKDRIENKKLKKMLSISQSQSKGTVPF